MASKPCHVEKIFGSVGREATKNDAVGRSCQREQPVVPVLSVVLNTTHEGRRSCARLLPFSQRGDFGPMSFELRLELHATCG